MFKLEYAKIKNRDERKYEKTSSRWYILRVLVRK